MEKNSKIIIIILTIVCLGLGGTVGYLVLNDSQEKCNFQVQDTDIEEEIEDDYYVEIEENNEVSISELKEYTENDIMYVYLNIPCQSDACPDPVGHQIVICDNDEIAELLKVFDNLEEKEQGPETGLIIAYSMEFIISDYESITVTLFGDEVVLVNGTEYSLTNASSYFYSFDGKTLTKKS